MPAPDLDKLARKLDAIGTAPAVVDRMLAELADHYADAEAAARARGLSRIQAQRRAAECIGNPDVLVSEVGARANLLDWRHRWPHTARCVDSATYCLLWPASPFVYCAAHPAGLVRWGLSSSLAVFVTASILFGLHWMIRIPGGF